MSGVLFALIVVTPPVAFGAAVGFWKRFNARISSAPEGWDVLPRRRRREIRRAVLLGERVDGTPDEARMAGDIAALLLRQFSGQRIAFTICVVLAGAAYWVFLAVRTDRPAWLILAVGCVAICGSNVWRWRHTAARLREAFAANYAAAS
jgi:hypothetical protein